MDHSRKNPRRNRKRQQERFQPQAEGLLRCDINCGEIETPKIFGAMTNRESDSVWLSV